MGSVSIIGGGSCGGSGGTLADHDSALTSVWRMNTVDPGPVLDATGNGYSLSKNGGLLFEQSGLNGNSVKTVSRSTDYLSRSAGFGPLGTEDFSLNMFFKTDTSGYNSLFCFQQSSTNVICAYLDTPTSFRLLYTDSTGTKALQTTVSTTLDSLWHMVTLTHDVSTKTVTLYLDSVAEITSTYTGVLDNFNASDFYIGRIVVSTAAGSNIFIDEARFWKGTDGCILPAAIAELYNDRDGYFP